MAHGKPFSLDMLMMGMWKIPLLRPEKLIYVASHTPCVLLHNSSMGPLKDLCLKQEETTTEEHLHITEMLPGHSEHYFHKQAGGEKKHSHPTSAFLLHGKLILQLYFLPVCLETILFSCCVWLPDFRVQLFHFSESTCSQTARKYTSFP